MNNKYLGAVHIHSTYSDGTSNIKEIASHAKKAGLSWIIITDHNNMKGYNNGEEGIYDGVVVLIGEEISPDLSNHYVALGLSQAISENQSPLEFIQEVKRQNGFGFIAHPDENLSRKNKYRALRWEDWSISGFDGIEIWNYLSDWANQHNSKSLICDYFNRHKLLNGPTRAVLSWWDSINNNSDKLIPAIGGADAHTFIYNLLGIKITAFNYIDCFKTIINCINLPEIMPNNFNEAKIVILNALKQGNNTIINRRFFKKADEFEFYVETNLRNFYTGEVVSLENSKKLVVKIPENAKIKLIYNGVELIEKKGKFLEYSNLKAGKYRLEIYCKSKPCLFTNPIVIV